MPLEIEPTDDPRGLRLRGELDIATEPLLREALESAESPEGDLTLDLTDLEFIDSSGIRTLLRAAERIAGHGSLILREPSPPVLRVFELMRLERAPGLELRRNGGV